MPTLQEFCMEHFCLDRAVGLGELNIGGGGIGPISDKGIGGSGSSDRTNWGGSCIGRGGN